MLCFNDPMVRFVASNMFTTSCPGPGKHYDWSFIAMQITIVSLYNCSSKLESIHARFSSIKFAQSVKLECIIDCNVNARMKQWPPPFFASQVNHIARNVLTHVIHTALEFIVSIYGIRLRYVDGWSVLPFLAVACCLFCSSFPGYVERTVTTLLSFHRMAAIFEDVWTATSDDPLSIFPTLSTDLGGGFSIRKVRTVPVPAIDFSRR